MMRIAHWTGAAAVAITLVLASYGSAHAQVVQPPPQPQRVETMTPVPTLPTIGLPLPRIGIPPVDESQHSGTTPPRTIDRTPRTDLPISVSGVGYLPPYFYLAPWYFQPEVAVTRSEAPAGRSVEPASTESKTGTLSLELQPAAPAQVFVDGFYSGAVADLQDRGLWLDAGPHRIEIREDGYQTEAFDVRIDEDRPAEYRRDLTKSAPRTDAPRIAANPKTFYVIPGCYAGDTPPEKDRLPSGCSARNVRTIPPVVSRLTPR